MEWRKIDVFILVSILEAGQRGEEVSLWNLANNYSGEEKDHYMEKLRKKKPKTKLKEIILQANRRLFIQMESRFKKMLEEGIVKKVKKGFAVLSRKVIFEEEYNFPDKESQALLVKEEEGWVIFEIEHDIAKHHASD